MRHSPEHTLKMASDDRRCVVEKALHDTLRAEEDANRCRTANMVVGRGAVG
jgi:hypothetical protein